MNTIDRLKDTMTKVKALIDFYKQNPHTELNMMDSITDVTMGDLEILLDGLAVRDISLKYNNEEVKMGLEERQEGWMEWYNKGFYKGYEVGRDMEMKRK